MIERLLPAGVAAAESTVDVGLAELWPAERAAIASAVAKRQAEFATVRHCARQALAALGQPPAPILPGARGAPGWPAGIVGSMTHCRGYRAAVLARASAWAGLGIDAEPDTALPAGVLELVAGPRERRQLAELGSSQHWDKLLFSIKEAVYKAWFPLTGQWLDFHAVSVRLAPDAGWFRADLQVPGPLLDGAELTGFDGRFAFEQGLVLAAVAVPGPARATAGPGPDATTR